ncbi:hypothetical protein EYF80_038718 [Liparis tanakae]|uniref:Uncharacterized protein n=1 Tax=Liparis tanakae TaxID=230148 RepID=A0A4Z2GEH6_9TELE|nr:hypothetical protein EYF80_038718 [Liparis tanakae]
MEEWNEQAEPDSDLSRVILALYSANSAAWWRTHKPTPHGPVQLLLKLCRTKSGELFYTLIPAGRGEQNTDQTDPPRDQPLLFGLSLHLLDLDGVGLAAAHVQLVVAHAQLQDALVDSQSGGVEYEILEE